MVGSSNITKTRLCNILQFFTAVKTIIIPPRKRSLRGVYCFESVRDSVIPSCRHSVIIFYRFCSVTFVALARFCSNFHYTLTIRHCMFYKKIGAEGSVLQELCHFVILNVINFFKGFAL